MRVPFYQIDAFTSGPFSGNPAAVMLLPEFLPDPVLTAIAAENNLSETAFVVARAERYHIRWFTPAIEVELCGHATLAAAFVLWEHLELNATVLNFDSLSGPLSVTRAGDLLALEFPNLQMSETFDHTAAGAALGLRQPPRAALRRGGRFLLELAQREAIAELTPDMAALASALPGGALYVTAVGAAEDFVCRVFAPGKGIDEDPVTGSAYTALAPYWAPKLSKSHLFARQLSKRGGEVWCGLSGETVQIQGRARSVIVGQFEVPL